MKPFGTYAQFYDLFYENKDYAKESEFVLKLARDFGSPRKPTILDIGCGTGGHLVVFGKKGLSVTGVDRSAEMIALAGKKNAAENPAGNVRIVQGDATSYRDGSQYDIVVSMFAVMGYLTSTTELQNAFATMRAHMKPSSVFIFDVWFGPTVLHELPETRIQEFKDSEGTVVRLVRPTLDVARQTVDVRYDIFRSTSPELFERITEVHAMRFFFLEELKMLLNSSGLTLAKSCPFMDDNRPPRLGDWNISVVALAQ